MPSASAFRPTRTAGTAVTALVALTLVWSCSGDGGGTAPPDTTPAAVSPVSGTDNQTSVVGTAVATPPSVTVTNAAGAGLAGVSVTFAVATGGGSASGTTATTDAQGVATVGGWVLGATAGPNTMTSDVGSMSATFTATAVAPPTQIVIVRGDGQAKVVGKQVNNPVVFAIRNVAGVGVPGMTINISPDGNGSVDNASPISDVNGEVSVQWTLATTPAGTQNLNATASISGVVPATATVTAHPAIEVAVVLVRGDNQTAAAGTAVATPPAVMVVDQYGNPHPFHTDVVFTPSGNGQVTGSPVATDSLGIATVGSWTLSTTPGANTLIANHGHLPTVTFNATGN